MITAKVRSIRVVGQEMLQEGGEVVAMPQDQVGTEHMLVHEAQVEVIAEGVYMHQITDLVALLCEQQGQLGRNSRRQGSGVGAQAAQSILCSSWAERGLALLPVAVGPAELPQPAQLLRGNFLHSVIQSWTSHVFGTGPFG